MSRAIEHYFSVALLAALMLATGTVAAQQPATASVAAQPPTGSVAAQQPDVVVGSIGDAKITVADYETSILRIPLRDRFGFAMSQKNVNQELDNLLQMRAIAEAAKRQGLDADPVMKRKMELYNDRILVEALSAKIEAQSVKEFEAKRSSYIEVARERYLVNKQQYQTPAEVKVSHILVSTNGRSADEAQAKIRALREQVRAGASFEELAVANSDDASVRNNRGDLGYFTPGQMDPVFEAAAFAMKKPGELSEPVHSRFGYHLIRFEDRKPEQQVPFEDALPDLMEKLKADFIEQKRSQAWKAIYDPEKIKWNEPAVLGLRKRVDPALLKVE